ncbi:MAG: aminoacyl-tRNA hydrolase [bacterium]
MKLIVGLGNPGPKYKNTWHNLGFLILENFQKEFNFSVFKKSAKLQAEISEGKIGNTKIILALPQTYMNNSGQSVSAIIKYYKINPLDIIVAHDDIDLPLGKIRLSKNSSAGGHNGIKSIIENLKTKEFARLKIGIATDKLEKVDVADYVLEKFGSDNKTKILEIKKTAVSALETAIKDGVERAMNLFN